MQIVPSGRQLEEQRRIEERSEKLIWKRVSGFPQRGGDGSAEGSRDGDLGLILWERGVEELSADCGE